MSKRSETLKAKFGYDYFSRLGKKGGAATKQRAEDEPDEFAERGSRGGNATLERYGRDHFARARRGEKSKPEEPAE